MNFGQQAGNFGSELLGTVTDIVDSVGDSFQNQTNAEAAKIAYLNAQTQIGAVQAMNQEKRKEQLTKLLMVVVYVLLFAGVGLILFKQLKK